MEKRDRTRGELYCCTISSPPRDFEIMKKHEASFFYSEANVRSPKDFFIERKRANTYKVPEVVYANREVLKEQLPCATSFQQGCINMVQACPETAPALKSSGAPRGWKRKTKKGKQLLPIVFSKPWPKASNCNPGRDVIVCDRIVLLGVPQQSLSVRKTIADVITRARVCAFYLIRDYAFISS